MNFDDVINFTYDPKNAFSQLTSNLILHICEFFINEKIFISAFFVYEVINNAQLQIIDIFKNFIVVEKVDKDKLDDLGSAQFIYFEEDDSYCTIDPCQTVENMEKVKGMFGGDIKILKLSPYFTNQDIFIKELAWHTFLYIVTKLNSILYSKNQYFKDFFDAVDTLRKQNFPFGNHDEKYQDCFSKNYEKYITIINGILKKISEFRNLKISQEIKRNTYIVALNNAIDYTFEENNLEFEKNILIKV